MWWRAKTGYDKAMESFDVKTKGRSQMVEITDPVQRMVSAAGAQYRAVVVYTPHTTAGITINENADPDVVHDMLKQLDQMVAWRQPFYQHVEGNSASHVKASMMGSSVTVLIEKGRLVLGRWQGIYLCEFDGPRTRQVMIQCHQ